MHAKNVVVMGLGYVGLPTAAIVASKGISVHGVDINPQIVETINRGEIHFIEPDLEGLVRYNVERELLKAHTSPICADVYIVAVPTPFKDDHRPDISYVESAIDMIASFLRKDCLVIIESTCPVGTTEAMASRIYSLRPDLKNEIFMAYCPERILPGQVLQELVHNERAIGGIDDGSTDKALQFYSAFVNGKLYRTSARTAELCKLAENSYRDVNIAFANELSLICDKAGVNINELIRLTNKHPRVRILNPGPGVGGHCIAVDPWFIVSDFQLESQLIKKAREVNDSKPLWVLKKIDEAIAGFAKRNHRKPVIACCGITYKPDIDDLRNSPSLFIAKELTAKYDGVMVVEPHVDGVPVFLSSIWRTRSLRRILLYSS